MQDYIEVKSNGKIIAKKGTNPRSPYNHQKDAMAKLSLIDKEESFSTLVQVVEKLIQLLHGY